MRPLIMITNDDGVGAKGLQALVSVARNIGDVVVMAPSKNSSGLAHSFTGGQPLRVNIISEEKDCKVYSCEGTPVDCVKICEQFFCERRPNIVLSGINHGSNASINVLYSGTMGAVMEASANGLNAIGFSLLDHDEDADFTLSLPFVRIIIEAVLKKSLPDGVSLNVNIPVVSDGVIKGIRLCRESRACWKDSYVKRIDPQGRPYYWLTGRFECNDNGDDTDQGALENGYVSVVPTTTDYTAYKEFDIIRNDYGELF
ncbi:MAG: 5'/3'-nucleotidase SurE [Bacteroidales bacterium]|nr:5'/3'-nucleotidase SurE [Bacteroidales bacterium]